MVGLLGDTMSITGLLLVMMKSQWDTVRHMWDTCCPLLLARNHKLQVWLQDIVIIGIIAGKITL